MPRYVAFLRGVSPMNAKMAELRTCYEQMGFTEVRTVLSSGNVIFTGPKENESKLIHKLETEMAKFLPRTFPVILRNTEHLRTLISSDPYTEFKLSPTEKRVVTFVSQPLKESLSLPIERDGARILAMKDAEVFTAYVPNERGPIFMALIEKTFGKNVTTRTWDTIKKCSIA